MEYRTTYASPIGQLLLSGEADALTGLWFAGQTYLPPLEPPRYQPGSLPVFEETKRWLDIYFSGKNPPFTPKLSVKSTPFRALVCDLLREIPYGETTTYGALAGKAAAQIGCKTMSAQAIGGAVGHNPISILIPCHRVLGAGGQLTGYAGGLWRKEYLLRLEGILQE